MSWRDHLPVHPAADLFPLMSEDELRELGENIKANGMLSPIILHQGMLLDGRNRLDAMESVDIKFDWKDVPRCSGGLYDEVDPYDFVVSANLHRRHLTNEQKRELIAKVLKAKPEVSNAVIAKQVRANDKTVAKVRRKLESTSEIPKLEKTVGADGKQRKSRAKKKAAIVETAKERDRKACVELNRKVLDAERERAQWLVDHPAAEQRATASPEISIEQRRADNARLDQPNEDPGDDMPTEQEANESWQESLYDQACLLLERMADETRRRFHDKYMECYGAEIERSRKQTAGRTTGRDARSEQEGLTNEVFGEGNKAPKDF
jgi:transposase-like protein